MSIFDKPPKTRNFLLTIWEERSQDPALPAMWRFRLEDPRTGQRRGFGDLEEMMAFLHGELDSSGAEAAPRDQLTRP
jgi:hypothetical protein